MRMRRASVWEVPAQIWEKKILRANTENFLTWTVYTTITQGQTLSVVPCVAKN